MADINSDDDPDSAAMAEAMGFTGFGMQRATRKRKLTPPAQTGANNAPLGKRRPLNLPQPVVSGGGGNAEEIDLDDDNDDDDGVGAQGDGGEAGEDVQAQAGLNALSFTDAPPATGRHQLPPKPQQQNHHHAGKAARHPGGRAGGGPGQVPWWERAWDPRLVGRMIENPWERLERQRGLGARGTWPTARVSRAGGDGDDAAAAPAGVGGGPSGIGGAMGSLGGSEQAAQATVS
ncbi:hypothetical protein INS49_013648 [Diaporthe citri]|uniref:uncharacterized protein n=1 Tax=Diaporthe citri TaxID=83186 RepID=UPI001C81D00F|nr:uncharacterized protein INS49_013648 [Diaporthe citri]KAG6357769.1 hypothetical protein INS49_013648 [Diaporthe citri]